MNNECLELPWTGERYVPQLPGNIALEHLHRYALASEIVKGKRVLDIASGEGYGSEMLSRTAASVVGVDIDSGTIEHAQKKYRQENLFFKKGRCEQIPLLDHSVDVVVSFETIEHLDDHEKMLSEIKRVLTPGGILIVSTPDKHEYTEVPEHHNQFHLKELYRNEFESLLGAYFKNQKILGQRIVYGSSIFEIDGPSCFGGLYEFNKLLTEGGVTKRSFCPLYLIACCSDGQLDPIDSTICEQLLYETEAYQSLSHQLFTKEILLNEHKTILSQQNIDLQKKEILLAEKENLINEKNRLIHETEKQLQNQAAIIDGKKVLLAEKEHQLADRQKQLVEQEELIEQKNILIIKKDHELYENSHLTFNIQNKKLRRAGIKALIGLADLKISFKAQVIALHIGRSNLFDQQWYLERYPDVKLAGVNPILHYINAGASEGRDPSPLFHTNWYLKENRDVAQSKVNPLYHYVKFGWKEGRSPNEASGKLVPFDKRKKIKKKFRDLQHKLKEQIKFYQQKWILVKKIYQHINKEGDKKSDVCFSTDQDKSVQGQAIAADIRLIAIYLPQYHPIKENNIWWGEGFTEWTNVKRAIPFYKEHYQPHIPHPDIGYYDLNDESVLEKQAQLAREHGIYGFCFYYYWFNGRRLLEKPTDRLLKSGKPDFPFCFCWANENWTRTWDGGDHQILIGQEHSKESDEQFIYDLIPALKDKRYIKIDNKPVIVIYRPALLPDMKKTAERWRRICRTEGIGEIYLAGMRSFELINPFKYGLDAAIQFPLSNVPAHNLASDPKLEVAKPFSGSIYSMVQAREFYSKEEQKFPLIRSVAPSWDNTARRMERGTSWINATPDDYYKWLCQAIRKTRELFKETERFIFINAWNEWGEGCHLEPDQKFGYAWLNATRKALENNNENQKPYFLVISHDAALAGAQILTLNILREWSKIQGVRFKIICVQGGLLVEDFKKLGETLILENYRDVKEQDNALKDFITPGVSGIYSSTVVNGPLLARLRYLHVPIITHAHELQKAIERWAPGEIIKATIENSDLILAGAPQVFENLQKNHGVHEDKMELLLAAIPLRSQSEESLEQEIRPIEAELGISFEDIVVFGCGTTDWRKGTDLFLKTAIQSCRVNEQLKFIWIGGNPGQYESEVKKLGLEKRILFLTNRQESRRYYNIGDIFFLSSREDPCPLVALEAADASLPIVCFSEAGNIPYLVKTDGGIVVPFEDIDAAVKAILFLAENKEARLSFGRMAQKRVQLDHNSSNAAAEILRYFEEEKNKKKAKKFSKKGPLVSVIVPNYNHAPFLTDRLKSITQQTYHNIEIIVLDDCSSDSSREIIENFLTQEPRAKAFFNERNSGSPFSQWKKGITLASGKYIWIAESDDLADSNFLSKLVAPLESDPSIILATSQLYMINKKGEVGTTPMEWLSEFNSKRWDCDYTNNGIEEIKSFLSKKNTILNASGVVIRNIEGLSEMVDSTMRLCADWLLWIRLLEKGNIAYVAEPLNFWRIGTGNARHKTGMELELTEGPKIISEIGRILKWDTRETTVAQDRFRARYQ